ncbi:unnamed protein product, partial [Closterium sp. Naga37s-1]
AAGGLQRQLTHDCSNCWRPVTVPNHQRVVPTCSIMMQLSNCLWRNAFATESFAWYSSHLRPRCTRRYGTSAKE